MHVNVFCVCALTSYFCSLAQLLIPTCVQFMCELFPGNNNTYAFQLLFTDNFTVCSLQ